jgi:CHAT domain-containing protein
VYYQRLRQYARALPFAKRHFETVQNISNRDTAYISAASCLADIYASLGNYDSAMTCYQEICEEVKKQYGDTSALYGKYLLALANVETIVDFLEKAGQTYQKVKVFLDKPDSAYRKTALYKSAYTRYLNGYALFHVSIGELNKAEELHLRAYKMALRDPVDSIGWIGALRGLGHLYHKMRFYAKQEAIALQILSFYKNEYGEENPLYAIALTGLANVYMERNQHLEKADSLYRKVLAMYRRSMGKNAPRNIVILNRLGIVNTEMGRYRVAEKYLKEAVAVINQSGIEYTPAVKNLARLYALTGRKKLAESLFQKCLTHYTILGSELITDPDLLHDMVELLYAGEPAKAAIYLKAAMVTEDKLLLRNLDFLPETELLAHLKSIKDVSDDPYRFLHRYKSPAIADAAYNRKLLVSGIGLQNTRALYQNMSRSEDHELTGLWKNYRQQQSYYTKLLSTPADKRNADIDSVAATLNRQEKALLRRSAEYRNMKERLAVSWQDVQKHLQPGETAVEFVRFNNTFNVIAANAKADTFYYAALLLRPQDTAPQFVVLCKEQQLLAAMKKFPYKAVANSRGQKPAGYVQSAKNALYRLVWQPLESYLTHTQTVYFSPDGLLHRVAFAAISYKNDALLCDRYNLVQLTSTRQVALQESRSPAPVSIALFGGINYNHQAVDTGFSLYAHISVKHRGAALDSFYFLPNTMAEINAIKADAETLQKQSVVFTGDNATEAAFRSLGNENSPEVIHFATHGFTFPDNTAEQGNNAGAPFKASDNPLLRCGLVMAGGNNGWKGKAGSEEDDGILTGLEISSVQLPHTQLAVLSACETGLGKIEGSEGVFGLQRAFKLAGVNYIMASLWQVPDKETAEFMETFYAQWLGGKTIREAFFTTQQAMRKKYAPYYWAGFTLVQ